jgi:hypothetical protein
MANAVIGKRLRTFEWSAQPQFVFGLLGWPDDPSAIGASPCSRRKIPRSQVPRSLVLFCSTHRERKIYFLVEDLPQKGVYISKMGNLPLSSLLGLSMIFAAL